MNFIKIPRVLYLIAYNMKKLIVPQQTIHREHVLWFYDLYTYFEFVIVNPTTNVNNHGVCLVTFVCFYILNSVKVINYGVYGY